LGGEWESATSLVAMFKRGITDMMWMGMDGWKKGRKEGRKEGKEEGIHKHRNLWYIWTNLITY